MKPPLWAARSVLFTLIRDSNALQLHISSSNIVYATKYFCFMYEVEAKWFMWLEVISSWYAFLISSSLLSNRAGITSRYSEVSLLVYVSVFIFEFTTIFKIKKTYIHTVPIVTDQLNNSFRNYRKSQSLNLTVENHHFAREKK